MKKPIIRGGSAALATLMTASLVTPMAPVMAAALPSAEDRAQIQVLNVDHKFNGDVIQGIGVKAYRIIEPVYDAANDGKGLVGFKLANALTTGGNTFTIKDFNKPTSEEINAIAAAVASNATLQGQLTALTLADDNNDGTWTNDRAPAGMYVVLVDGGQDVADKREQNLAIYNPMIVSVNYSDANDASTIGRHIQEAAVTNDGNKTGAAGADAAVDADKTFAYGSIAYAKKSQPTIDKNIKVATTSTSYEEDDTNGTYYKKAAVDEYILITAYEALDAEGKALYSTQHKYAQVNTPSTSLVKGDTVSADGTNSTTASDITFQIDTKIPSYVSGASFSADADGAWDKTGAWYKLKDGTYTQVKPEVATAAQYADTITYDDPSDPQHITNIAKYKEDTKTTAYQSVRFDVSDVLDETFDVIAWGTNDADFHVEKKVGSNWVAVDKVDDASAAGANGYQLVKAVNNKGFTVKFSKAYVLNNANADIRITYGTKLLDNISSQNFAENHNRATLTYANDPSDATSVKTVDKDTYHYTFALDANIDAEATDNTKKHETFELNKVTEGMESLAASYENSATPTTSGTTSTQKSKHALEGAIFGLYTSEDAAKTGTRKSAGGANAAIVESTSDANGHFEFTGLDEGTYYIKEVAAPAGYTRNDTLFKAEIVANLGSDGIMTGYTVTIQKKAAGESTWSAAGSATYTATKVVNNDGSVNYTITENTTPMEVIDTKLNNLPSTGGVGTMPFIISGMMAMAGAAGILGIMKKKEAQN